MKRWLAAVAIAALLLAPALVRRRHRATAINDRPLVGVAGLLPATYYYTVLQGNTPIGVASSALQRSAGGIRLTDVVTARAVVYGDSQTVRGSSTAFLSGDFVLDSFTLALGGDQGPFRLRGVPQRRSGVLLPTLTPMALMLSGGARVGRSGRYWVFNPLSQRVELTTLAIGAESLLTVVDSARYDVTRDEWVPAHSDTVRGWSISTPAGGMNAWVDAAGRVISATEPGGLSIARTAPEIASQRGRASAPSAARSGGSISGSSSTR